MSVSENAALFSLLGDTYGGNGNTTFLLPDLRGRVPVCVNYNEYKLGEDGGAETVTLTTSQIPSHNHTGNITTETKLNFAINPPAVSSAANTPTPGPTVYPAAANGTAGGKPITAYTYSNATPNTTMAPVNVTTAIPPYTLTTSNTGGSTAHANVQPYLSLHYIICTSGMYPERP